jgi:hypothetical protein
MIAYRDLLLTFTLLFAFLSVLMFPAIYYYNGHDGIVAPVKYSKQSIGNMGYSSAQCSNIPLEVGKMSAQCPYGQIGEIFHFGVNPSIEGKVAEKALCQVTDFNNNCTN